jgi:hypothetical protein
MKDETAIIPCAIAGYGKETCCQYARLGYNLVMKCCDSYNDKAEILIGNFISVPGIKRVQEKITKIKTLPKS